MGSGEAGMSYSIEELATFTTTAGRPIVVIFGSARPTSSGNVDDAKGFVSFYDGETQKLVKKIELLGREGANPEYGTCADLGMGLFTLSSMRLTSIGSIPRRSI